jgi:hypothetical protein
MSKIDIIYMGLVLSAFVGFAGVLAYYSQTCAEPDRRQSEGVGKRVRTDAAH